ncbi:MAG TPA: exo-alpha-sialidase, partial [Thermoflexus sp.]|nr:exo-alpha-sialidase [Thermoflexus sp.]
MALRTRRWPLIGLLFSVLVGATGMARAQEPQIQWERPIRVADPYAWFPDVVADDAGRVVVLWAGGMRRGREQYDALFLRMKVGDQWEAPVDIYAGRIINDESYAVRNAVLLDPMGQLILAYRHPQTAYVMRAPIEQAESARAWSEPIRISRASAYYVELGQGTDGVLHLIWTEVVPSEAISDKISCAGCSDVFYRSSADGGQTWSAPINLSRSPYGSMKPFLWVSSRAPRLYVVWQEGYDSWVGRGSPVGVGWTRSLDGGRTWEAPRLITSPVGTPQQPVIGEDGGGQLLMLWRTVEDEALYFQRSSDQGETWSPPQPIPGFRARPWSHPPFDAYDLVADSAGRLHLAAVGVRSPEGDLGIFHLMWDGSTWWGPFLVWADGQFPEWPRWAISEGRRLHLVWFERDPPHLFDSDNGQYTVWYATALTDAPRVMRTPRPRPTPTAAPTPIRLE